MIFKIVDGRSCFYQWDIDRQISVSDPTIKEVHFCNKTDSCSLVVEVKDGIANVPNKVLQNGYKVRVFGYDGKATLHEATFEVKARTKPIDYVYTEVEIKNYETALEYIDEKLEDIVNNGVKVDLTDYYTKEEVDTAIENVEVDLNGYATEEYVTEATKHLVVSANPDGNGGWKLRDEDGPLVWANPYRYTIKYKAVEYVFYVKKTDCLYYQAEVVDSADAPSELTVKAIKITTPDLTITELSNVELASKNYVDEAISNIDIPEAEVDLSNYYTKEETSALIPTNVSELENDAKYVTSEELIAKNYMTEQYADIKHRLVKDGTILLLKLLSTNSEIKASYNLKQAVARLNTEGVIKWAGTNDTAVNSSFLIPNEIISNWYKIDEFGVITDIRSAAESFHLRTNVVYMSYPSPAGYIEIYEFETEETLRAAIKYTLGVGQGGSGGLTEEEVQDLIDATIASLDSDEVEY